MSNWHEAVAPTVVPRRRRVSRLFARAFLPTMCLCIAAGRILAQAIVQQPAPLVFVTAGETATLSVTTSGAAPAFQWRRLGQPIAGATANTLTLSNVALTDAGRYDVVVTFGTAALTSQ